MFHMRKPNLLMYQDRSKLALTAIGILLVLCLSVLFPVVRNALLGLLVLAVAGIVLLALALIVFLILFNRGIQGPKSLSGRRCRNCGKWWAMREVGRDFLRSNVKVDFDHYRVVYRCSRCGQKREQEEHVFP